MTRGEEHLSRDQQDEDRDMKVGPMRLEDLAGDDEDRGYRPGEEHLRVGTAQRREDEHDADECGEVGLRTESGGCRPGVGKTQDKKSAVRDKACSDDSGRCERRESVASRSSERVTVGPLGHGMRKHEGRSAGNGGGCGSNEPLQSSTLLGRMRPGRGKQHGLADERAEQHEDRERDERPCVRPATRPTQWQGDRQ